MAEHRRGETPAGRSDVSSDGVSFDAAASSVDKALKLLKEVARRGEMRVSEAAEHLGVARSTAHRLLTSLVRSELVHQTRSSGPYAPSAQMQDLATASAPREGVMAVAPPFVLALRNETEETTHLTVLQGNSVRFVFGYPGLLPDHSPVRAPQVLPAHATACGKALLATLRAESLPNLYPRGLQVLTSSTIRSIDDLTEHLRGVARRGYAVNSSESAAGVTAIGVAVRDADSIPVAAITVAAPPERMPPARIPHVVARLQRTALEIQAALLASNKEHHDYQ